MQSELEDLAWRLIRLNHYLKWGESVSAVPLIRFNIFPQVCLSLFCFTQSPKYMVVQKLFNLNSIVTINETQTMIKHLLWNASARCYDSTAICSQPRTRHFDVQSNLQFRLYIKPSNRINLVMLNLQSKLRETLSICAKYKTIKSFRSTMRQVNDAPSKQRNSGRQNLWIICGRMVSSIAVILAYENDCWRHYWHY
jgi:hypothetical protein